MTTHLRIFLRGLGMVALVSANTSLIAHGHMRGAMLVSFLISALWWVNSARDRPQARGAWAAVDRDAVMPQRLHCRSLFAGQLFV